jgi:CRISPR-associated protein Cas5t
VIGVHVTVPIACFRKGPARELVETERLPPPATVYGALLSLVGEVDRERHRGCRVTAGRRGRPEISVVLRTRWQVKDLKLPPGEGANAGPDLQQLLVDGDFVLWCDGGEEAGPAPTLEQRVRAALERPHEVARFGGWSLGESTFLVNDAVVVEDVALLGGVETFVEDPEGDVTLPLWVDHVGSAGTRYAVGRLIQLGRAPLSVELPRVPVLGAPEVKGKGKARRSRS